MTLILQRVLLPSNPMQSFDTKRGSVDQSADPGETLVVGGIDDLRPGTCLIVELPDGHELAVFNVNGEYYATENSCPHKGAPLSEGTICGHVVECGWHGWQFDVRSGECLTVREKIKTYCVRVEDGLVKVDV